MLTEAISWDLGRYISDQISRDRALNRAIPSLRRCSGTLIRIPQAKVSWLSSPPTWFESLWGRLSRS